MAAVWGGKGTDQQMAIGVHHGTLGGVPTHWRQFGADGGRPVLALHCSLAHGGEWAALAAALQAESAGLTLHAPDLCGHGRMPEWDGLSDLHGQSTAIAADLAAKIGHGGPVDVIGHSFGGTIALRLALERPGLIRRMVLVEPVLFAAAKAEPAIWQDFRAGHQPFETLLAAGEHAAALRSFLAIWGGDVPFDDLPPSLAAYMRARIRTVAAQDAVLMADAAGMLAAGRLEALAAPVLLVDGASSPQVVGAIHRTLLARLPNARALTIPGARHMLPVTHPQALATAVCQHLGL